ncbi:hypothetical protein AZ34_03800 [Hylemonella gracilis str. Niagara R]|uniref:Uncharacterized protein n=1 Tax=Hylemonella gracilis str. Niagara R TaxID=1458275 RepID=A0A016XKZ9_9BURK|nr:hypothetical protein [Hylemonella gracilis]EYC52779.1 hypothetical protein AZ34_03800 [Hylemonella gracilis str. Niagara R]
MLSPRFLLLVSLCLGLPAHATEEVQAGQGGFCLFELPEDGGKRRYINLNIVQYVEVGKDDFKIVYGGGALGSGHESKFALKSPDEGQALMERLLKTARACAH